MMAGTLGGRLPLLAPAELAPAARVLHERLLAGRLSGASPFRSKTDSGELLGPFNALLYVPRIGGGFIDFHEAEEHSTLLSARVREVVILSVGAVWGSAYELYAHRAVATKVGFSASAVASLASAETDDELTDDERLAQRFTLELMRDRQVSAATYAMTETAFGRDGVFAMTFLAAAYAGTCTLLNAFAVPAPADTD